VDCTGTSGRNLKGAWYGGYDVSLSGLPERSSRPSTGVAGEPGVAFGYAVAGIVPDQWSRTKPGGPPGTRTRDHRI